MNEAAEWWKSLWKMAISGWERSLECERELRAEVEAMRAVVKAAVVMGNELRRNGYDAFAFGAAKDALISALDALPKEGVGDG